MFWIVTLFVFKICFVGTEEEEARLGAHPFLLVPGTAIVDIVLAVVDPLFPAALQLMCPDLGPLQRLGGEGPHLRAEADQNQGRHWTLSLQSRQAKQGQGQGHLLEVLLVKGAWSLTMMFHLTQEGE